MHEQTFDFTGELATCRDTFRLDRPINVALGEADDVARLVERYWEPVRDEATGITRPGLKSSRLKFTVAAEIRALAKGVTEQRQRYQAALVPRGSQELLARGNFLLTELTGAIAYRLDDGVEDESDVRLEHLRQEHADADAIDEIALALEDYAEMARPMIDELDDVGGFEARYIDEAIEVAKRLRALPPPNATLSEEARIAMATRNRYLELLQRRVSEVRKAIAYVFRNHPVIVRESHSAWLSRRRAAARRAAALKASTQVA